MARKKIEPIVSLGNEDKLTVQKSLPLFSLWRSELTLAEFKILDTYLARIDSHHPEKRTVTFEKGELEEKLGVERIRIEELDERLKHLGTPIRIDDTTAKNKRFARISLFEKAVAEQDEFGLWQVELTASQSAMKYFFNVENLGYLRYKLRCITSLTSRYSYIMFTYLEHNRYRTSWDVDLPQLKEILSCDKEEVYKEFKFFNQKILKRVQKELHEKTECRYTYEPIKTGRRVTSIRFTVETLQAALDEIEPDVSQQIALEDDTISFLSGACCGEFTREQMEVIFSIISTKSLPENPDGIDFARYHYLDRMYRTMQLAASKKPIKHRFDYFLAMLKNEK